MSVRRGEPYRFSVWARSLAPGAPARLRVELIDPSTSARTQVLAADTLSIPAATWQRYELTLTPAATAARGRMRIFLEGHAGADLAHISDLPPGVLRFPGGCIVEGTDLPTRYQWKNTVGPVENRPLNENRWHYTFTNRFFPDYYQSYGLGFFEYFQLAEDIGAEPLPVLNVGLACQYQNDSEDAHCPVDSLQPYIDDVLNLIESPRPAGAPYAPPWAIPSPSASSS